VFDTSTLEAAAREKEVQLTTFGRKAGNASRRTIGADVPVQARHVTDPTEARSLHAHIKQKYNTQRPASRGDEPPTPAEEAVFELRPEPVG